MLIVFIAVIPLNYDGVGFAIAPERGRRQPVLPGVWLKRMASSRLFKPDQQAVIGNK
ncbi:hypothetical protein ACFSE1_04975 [Rhizobium helianthi]|uniref:Uncharacterized protein n=1 Tax=Rhizobium helianthi TaxID=1132695 RepID=A0ABW4M1M1_9HYPH